jgi:hypothetical protein
MTHFRYTSIDWTVPNLAQPLAVTFHIQEAWRADFPFTYVVGKASTNGYPQVGNILSGSEGTIAFGGTGTLAQNEDQNPLLQVLSVNTAQDWIYVQVVHSTAGGYVEGELHTYAQPGNYLANVNGCCTLSALLNGQHDENFQIETEVTVGSGAEPASPVMNVEPIVSVPNNATGVSFQLPATDPNGKQLTFRLATETESNNSGYPTPGLSVTSSGLVNYVPKSGVGLIEGEIVATEVAAPGILTPQPSTTTLFLFNVVTPASYNPPSLSVSPSSIYYFAPGVPLSFSTTATAVSGDTISSLQALNSPDGMIFSPLATSGTQGSVTASWTPTPTDSGQSYVVTFQATDSQYDDAETSVTLIPEMTPAISVIDNSHPYSGNPFTAAATVNGAATLEGVGLMLDYVNTDTNQDLGAIAPTSVGNYNVTASFPGSAEYLSGSASVSFSITPAAAAIQVSAYDLPYDGAAHTATGLATGVQGEDLSADLTLTGTTHTAHGVYTDTWSFKDPNGNYQSASGVVIDAISQAAAVIQVNGYTTTYDANPHTATGTAAGSLISDLSADLDLGATTHVNAGTYSDTWTFHDPDGNYQDANGMVTDTIGQAAAMIAVLPYAVSYDASAHTATGSAVGVAGEDLSADLNLAGTTHVNAGTYQDAWSFHDPSGNYQDADGMPGDAIFQAVPTVMVNGYNSVYNGTPHTATGIAMGVGGADVTFDLNLGSTVHKNAGSYVDQWTFVDPTGNYRSAGGSVNDNLAQAPANITVNGYSVTFDGNAHAATGMAGGVPTDNLAGDLSLGATVHINAGTYSDPWTFHDPNGNYQDASGSVNDSIAQAMAAISVIGYSVTFDGNPHVAIGTAIGISGENLGAGLVLGGTLHVGAGAFTDPWKFHDPNGNYQDASETVTDTISQAKATISVNGYSVTFDGSPHTATGTAAGSPIVNLSADLALGATTHTNVGVFSDAWTFHDPNGNYQDASGTVMDTISQAKATISVNGYSVVYDGSPHTAAGTATGAAGTNLNADLTLTGSTHTNAGTFSDTWKFHDPGGNYQDATGSVSDSILQAKATISVNGYSVSYDGNPHTATGTAAGALATNLNADLDLAGTTHTIVGAYSDTWTFHDPAGNYQDASGSVSDAISLAMPVVKVTDSGGVYKAAPYAATGSVSGLNNVSIGTPTFSYYLASDTALAHPLAGAPSDIGGYVVVGSYAGGGNYAKGSASASFTITPAPTTVALTSSTKGSSYYGQSVTFSATVSPVAPATGTPAGSIQFFIYNSNLNATVSLGVVALNKGSASLTVSSLPLGADTITATYIPVANSDFQANSGSLAQAVSGGIVLLDTSGKGALTVSGAAKVVATGTSIVVDSNNAAAVIVNGSASVQASATDVVGKISASGVATVANASTGQPSVADPLASLPTPTTSGQTIQSSSALSIGGSSVVTLKPGVYVGGINIGGAAKVTLSPGEYYLQGGGFVVGGSAKVTGAGVFIYNAPTKAADQFNFSGAASVTLSPMTTGAWAGITLFQARGSANVITVAGSGVLNVTGTVYAASALVDISGAGVVDTFGTSLIADDLNVSGSGELLV